MSDDLERRVRRLEDGEAIVSLMYRYSHSLDYGDEPGFVHCFAEDGAFIVRRRSGEPFEQFHGREALAAFVASHSRAPEGWHKHVMSQPLIELDGDAAGARAYFFLLQDDGEQTQVRMFGHYEDRLRRCADGRWRFVERVADVESVRAGLPPLMAAHVPTRGN